MQKTDDLKKYGEAAEMPLPDEMDTEAFMSIEKHFAAFSSLDRSESERITENIMRSVSAISTKEKTQAIPLLCVSSVLILSLALLAALQGTADISGQFTTLFDYMAGIPDILGILYAGFSASTGELSGLSSTIENCISPLVAIVILAVAVLALTIEFSIFKLGGKNVYGS